MSKVLSLHGKSKQPARSPEEEKLFNADVEALKTAERYVIVQSDPSNPGGPMRMQHNLHPAELNLLLDQLKLINLDSLFYGDEEG
jgi:hypothetical protein